MRLRRRKPKLHKRVTFNNQATELERYRIWTVTGLGKWDVVLTTPKIGRPGEVWSMTIRLGRFQELDPRWMNDAPDPLSA